MSYVNKWGDYKPFKIMRIIKSVSKQYSWNNFSKCLFSSVATVLLWESTKIVVDLAFVSGGLTKLNSHKRIIRGFDGEENNGENKKINKWKKIKIRKIKINKKK